VAALALVITFTWTITSGFSGMMDEAVDQHSTAPPVEVNSSDTDVVEDWFREKVNFNVALPRFQSKQLDLVGARLSHLGQRNAALIRYRRGTHTFSLFVVTDPGGSLEGKMCQRVRSREICLTELRGYTVVLWRSRGLAYSLVGDTAPKEMVNVLSSAQSF
jgi:anti-sigma factor RsiW